MPDEKYTLFTSLEHVVVDGVRTHTHALLLCDAEAVLDRTARRLQLRGFGTQPEWPTFDLDVESLQYTMTDARSGAIMITDSHPEGRPLSSGAIMQFANGPRVDLIVCDSNKPIVVQRFDGRITRVWEVLSANVRAAWTAPNMPMLEWIRVR